MKSNKQHSLSIISPIKIYYLKQKMIQYLVVNVLIFRINEYYNTLQQFVQQETFIKHMSLKYILRMPTLLKLLHIHFVY